MNTKKNKSLINTLIKNKSLPASQVNSQLIKIAQNNRVLYALSKRSKSLSDVMDKGNIWIDSLKKTLVFIDECLKDIPHVTTRTYKYVPYVTFDVDLFVSSSDYLNVIALFKKAGCKIESHDSSLGGRIINQQKNILKDGLVTIDLHRDFTWQKRRFLDRSLLFENTRRRKIAGIMVDIPSAEVEFILCLADVGHERFNFTLLDLIWLEGLSKEIKNWNLIFDQVRKYGWNKTFGYLSGTTNTFSEKYYEKKIVPGIEPAEVRGELPFFIPFHICWLSYLENFKKTRKFPIVSFLYMHYTKARYYLSGKKRMPYYSDWYQAEHTA